MKPNFRAISLFSLGLCCISLGWIVFACVSNPKVADKIPITGVDLTKKPTAEGADVSGDRNNVVNVSLAGSTGVLGLAAAVLGWGRRRNARSLDRVLMAVENTSTRKTGRHTKKAIRAFCDPHIDGRVKKKFG